MKSIIFDKYGDSNSLKIGNKDKPNPKNGEVLLKLKASSVNDWDWDLLKGKPYINRLLFGVTKPKIKTLGIDVSGVIEFVGENVKTFRVGDEVYGDVSGQNWGGYQEYVCVNESELRLKTKNISHEQAASIPHSGVLAMQSFLDYKKIEEGTEVLINGAGGGAGTIAIQLGKYRKMVVTAVDKRSKFETMKKMGADKVIDYLSTDFTRTNEKYNLIIDFSGSHPLLNYNKSLKRGGRYLLVGGKSSLILKTVLIGPILSMVTGKKFKVLMHKQNKHLKDLTRLIENNTLKPTVGKIFKLEQVPEALDYFGSGQCNGKIIINIE